MSNTTKQRRFVSQFKFLFARFKRFSVSFVVFALSFLYLWLGDYWPNVGSLGDAFNEVFRLVLEGGAPMCFLALAVSSVIATSNIDLSIAGVATLGGLVYAMFQFYLHEWGIPGSILFALIPAVGLGFIMGTLSGALVYFRRLPSLIFTWAIGVILFILAVFLSDHSSQAEGTVSGVPLQFRPIKDSFWDPFGTGFWITLVGILLYIILIKSLKIDLNAPALGSHEGAAINAGVNKGKTVIMCFAVSGGMASFAGIVHALTLETASTRDLFGSELIAISIAVLGGTALSGGYLGLWSIVFASFAWGALKHVSHGFLSVWEDATQIKGLEQVLFAAVMIIAILFFGRMLSPELPKIYIRREGDKQ